MSAGKRNSIPEDAGIVIDRYVELVEQCLPGRVEGLYLVGSVALGDYKPGLSDVDFVATTGAAFTAGDLDRLEEVHTTLQAEIPKPWFDGIYVTCAELERNPEDIGKVPSTHEGKFERTGGFEANPSTWLTLLTHPLSALGPLTSGVWYDPGVIRQWNVENLNTYWRSLLERGQSTISRAAALASDRVMSQAIAWCVPGVARLHYTVVTGDVTSKSGACHYALASFPERWHTVIGEALALRNNERLSRRSRAARRRDVLDFMELVIEDATARAGGG